MFPAKEIMTKKVIAVKPDTPIYEAIEMLVKFHISGIPVVDKDKNVVGLISEWDMLRLLSDEKIDKNATVNDFMTADVITFDEESSAVEICEFFRRSNKRRVPIVRNNKLIGIVSRHDILKVILDLRKKL
ncbi:MAG: CBS domain-containing protein [Candidatus Omnitrophica bacterium]|nr:CBS domain-containing protein [Candidatus Omnitrophota bacterium]